MALDDKDYAARVAACKALAAIAPATKEAADALLRSFNGQSQAARRARRDIAEYLARCRPDDVLPGLRTALRSDNDDTRLCALRVLIQMKEKGATSLPGIAAAAKSPMGFERRLAAEALASCGGPSPEAQQALLAMLGDDKPLVRLEVIRQIPQIGQVKLAAETLARALSDSDERVRMAAAYAMAQLSPEAAATAVAALKAESPLARAAAVRAIGLSAAPPKGGPEAVAMALQDTHAEVRASAAQALAWLGGTAAASAYPALLKLRQDADPWVRAAAVAAMRHGGDEAIALLVEALGDTDYKVRREASAALAEMKGKAVSAVAGLTANGSADLRWRALETLKRMGPTARDALPVCAKALHDQAWYVRREAVRALAAIAPKDEAVAARLREAVQNDEEWTVRKESFDALREWKAHEGLQVRPY
jgi:HEAT repeat protein